MFEIQPEELVSPNSIIINHNKNSGGGYLQIVNQLSDKVIEQYETRLKEKDERLKEKDEIIKILREEKNNF